LRENGVDDIREEQCKRLRTTLWAMLAGQKGKGEQEERKE
jgi:hypothetical protein